MSDKKLSGPTVNALTAADLDTITIRISKGPRTEPELDDDGKPTGALVKAIEAGESQPRPDAGEPWLVGAGFTARTSEGKRTSGIQARSDHPAKVVAALKTIRDYVLEIAQDKIAKASTLSDV